MFAQNRKARFFSRLLYLSIFIAFIVEVNGESWSATWSWQGEERRPRIYLTDEQVIDMLYSRASRSDADHPSFLKRMEYKKIRSLSDLHDVKEAVERYASSSNRRNSKTSSYYHRVYHQ